VVVVVPSLINPPTVLDLAPHNSLLGHLAASGLRPLLVDWGMPGPDELNLDLAGHVEARLLPLVEGLGEPVALAGYCLGGTLALAAAARTARVTRLALLAAPWRFTGYSDAARAAMGALWRNAAPLAAPLGALPMDMLQPAFWSLDPQALVSKFERFATLPDGPESDAFVALEDWANDGPPLALPAAHGLAEDLYGADRTGQGQWEVGGSAVDPAALRIPLLDIVATRDRIVPPASALSAGGGFTALAVDAGHVGMVVGSRAPNLLWEPLARWLREG
jgi:polyhydroxyalkanoate synthase